MKHTSNLRRTLVAFGLCAAVIVGFMAGCRNHENNGEGGTPTHPPAEDTGIVLNLFQPHHGHTGLWQALAADYQNLTGVTVNVHSPTAGSEALSELRDALEGDHAPGLFVFQNPREHRVWHEHAHDLSGTDAYQRLTDRNLALVAGEEEIVVGLPLGIEAFGIIYNSTVMDAYFALDERETDFDSIADVNTHAELAALVRDMHLHLEELGIDGVFAAPAFGEGESTAWGTRLLSIPVGHEIKTRNLDVTGDEINELNLNYHAGWRGFHELHFEHATTREGLENRTYANAADEFATGRAAMILGSTDFVGYLNAAGTIDADDIAFLPVFMNIPNATRQGLAFETVHYAAINGRADEEQLRAAEDFLDWLVTSERGMEFLVNQLNVIAPYDSVIEGMEPQNPLAVSAIYWLQNENVENVITHSHLAYDAEFRDEVVGAGMHAVARGERAWDNFVEDIRERWAEHRERMDEAF